MTQTQSKPKAEMMVYAPRYQHVGICNGKRLHWVKENNARQMHMLENALINKTF